MTASLERSPDEAGLLAGTGPAHRIIEGPWPSDVQEWIEAFESDPEDVSSYVPLSLTCVGSAVYVLERREAPLGFRIMATRRPVGNYSALYQGCFKEQKAAELMIMMAQGLFPGVERSAPKLPPSEED